MVAPLASRPDATAPVLAAVAELAPRLAARAAETEAGRRLPPDLVDELRAAGCFRMLLPRSHGGEEVDLVTGMRVLEELARADGSAGWTVGIGGAGWLDLCHLPRATFDALYAGGPIVTAGVIAPPGTAVAGGRRLRGQRPLGVRQRLRARRRALRELHRHRRGRDAGEGPPPMRVAMFAPEDIAIEDTWTVSGLCGTGSHHVRGRRRGRARRPHVRADDRRAVRRHRDDPHPPAHAVRLAGGERGPRHRPGRPRRRPGAGPRARSPCSPRRPSPRGPCSRRRWRRRTPACGRPGLSCARTRVSCSPPPRPARRSPSSCAPGSGRRPRGPPTRRRRSSTPPTGPAAARRCTRPARCSAACVTSMPSRSTSSSGPTRWSRRVPSWPARTPTRTLL